MAVAVTEAGWEVVGLMEVMAEEGLAVGSGVVMVAAEMEAATVAVATPAVVGLAAVAAVGTVGTVAAMLEAREAVVMVVAMAVVATVAAMVGVVKVVETKTLFSWPRAWKPAA